MQRYLRFSSELSKILEDINQAKKCCHPKPLSQNTCSKSSSSSGLHVFARCSRGRTVETTLMECFCFPQVKHTRGARPAKRVMSQSRPQTQRSLKVRRSSSACSFRGQEPQVSTSSVTRRSSEEKGSRSLSLRCSSHLISF